MGESTPVSVLTDVSLAAIELLRCRYGLSADIYSFGITIIEAALGHTPYVDMSFEQIAMKKAVNAGIPMLAVNTHGRHFSQVGISQPPELSFTPVFSSSGIAVSVESKCIAPHASMQRAYCLGRAGSIPCLSLTLPLKSLLQAGCGLKRGVAHDGT